ncbi:uncharacterized protein LOC131801718 [Musca domestica]|uniref:Uncharacterized protein LOC101897640 n=1 Tax=Musca domestica TaxID=7370 RepID=A0A1I8M545_MUSDO|nr:uncharacterized protein LOC101897640 [Musca domestica]XP_058976640.1 uncharacterized protein LOC131801718 [Musca domestica]
MSCCNIRSWSLIIGWVNAVVALLVFIALVAFACVIDDNYAKENNWNEDQKNAYFAATILGCVLCVISFILNVMLIVGIYQARIKLLAIYIYAMYVSIGLGVIAAVITFIVRLIYKDPAGDAFLNFLRNLVYIAFEVIIFSPVYMLYKKITEPEPELQEHRGPSNNDSANKSTPYSGHI